MNRLENSEEIKFITGEDYELQLVRNAFGKKVFLQKVIPRNQFAIEGNVIVEGLTYDVQGGLIGWDLKNEQWDLSRRLTKGFFRDSSGVIQEGLFRSEWKLELCSNSDQSIWFEDEDVAISMGYFPALNANHYIRKEKVIDNLARSSVEKQTFGLPISTTHSADSGNRLYSQILDTFNKKYLKKIQTSFESKMLAKLFKGLSFGIEYETAVGAIQSASLAKLGLVPLIDGSLSSRNQYEYTSIPMSGAKGFELVSSQCKRLNRSTTVDSNCALHVHVGGFSRNREVILAMFHLFYLLQEEIFSMIPYYKQDERSIFGKQKNYSPRIMPIGIESFDFSKTHSSETLKMKVDHYYKELAEYTGCGQTLSSKNNEKRRAEGSYRGPWRHKWHCPTRYAAFNIVPYFFSPSGTVEFRVHEPTTNFTKVINWLTICLSICKFAENNAYDVLSLKSFSLDELFSKMTPSVGSQKTKDFYNGFFDQLREYVEWRKNHYQEIYKLAHKNSGGSISGVNEEMARLFSDDMSEDSHFSEIFSDPI